MTRRKTILITGGARGIGKALSIVAAGAGYDVAINSRAGRDKAEARAADAGTRKSSGPRCA